MKKIEIRLRILLTGIYLLYIQPTTLIVAQQAEVTVQTTSQPFYKE